VHGGSAERSRAVRNGSSPCDGRTRAQSRRSGAPGSPPRGGGVGQVEGGDAATRVARLREALARDMISA
jgi:hypothetical protein